MSEVLIKAENVGKKFCRDLKKSLWYGVKDSIHDLVGSKANTEELRHGEFWANQDISFELKRGECLGLIGRNGAGKTTLLKMLNGLVKPDAGRISMHGHVSAMIALGAGFNPVLTGRENIYVNGSILGLSQRYIHDRLESIVDFAEIGDAIDSPVRTYSSGMQVRLGFSVASNLIEPDILLLDEVLAVGDMGFRIKCLNRVRELSRQSAVILVSHTMQNIGSFCNRALLLSNARLVLDTSDVSEAIVRYDELFETESNMSISGNGKATLLDVKVVSGDQVSHSRDVLDIQGFHVLEIKFRVDSASGCVARIGVRNASGDPVILTDCVDSRGKCHVFTRGIYSIRVSVFAADLTMGRYVTHLLLKDEAQNIAIRADGLTRFQVNATATSWARLERNAPTVLVDCLSGDLSGSIGIS